MKTAGKARVAPATDGWHDILDSALDAVFVVDCHFTIQRANSAFTGLTGNSRPTAVGQKCFALMHGTTAPPPWCPHNQCLTDRAPVVKKLFEPHLGLDLLVSISPIWNSDEEMTGCIHVVRDIKKLAPEEETDLRRIHGWLQGALKAVTGSFVKLNGKLAAGPEVSESPKDLERLFFETRDFLDRSALFLRKLAGSMTFSSGEECHREARHLYSVTKMLGLLLKELQKLNLRVGDSPAQTGEAIGSLIKSVIEVSRDSHRLGRKLFPSILKERDPVEAIGKECKSVSALTGRVIVFRHGRGIPLLPGVATLALTSILAETLENGEGYDRPDVIVTLTPTRDSLKLSIAGRGVAYDPGFGGPRAGLSAISEWVRALKGRISVETRRGNGNRIIIEASIPGRKGPPTSMLSERQREVLFLLAQGHVAKQIGTILGISKKTVEFHKHSMMKRLGAKSVVELVGLAVRDKLIAQ